MTVRVKSKRPVSKIRLYWWLGPVLLGVAAILWMATGPEWSHPRTGKTTDMRLPAGYVATFATVAQEYRHFYGKAVQDKDLETQFEEATRQMTDRNYATAAQMLEDVARNAAVPAIFNDLGLVYLALNDRANAINSFRETLARDIDYPQVRRNMERIKEIGIENAAPVTHEIEANNTPLLANIISPDRGVDGEIMAGVNDIDCFRVTAPPAPRDILRIEVVPRSRLLSPMMRIFDRDRRMLEWVREKSDPGQTISVVMSPPANATLFLEIAGFADSAGIYHVNVIPSKAFDAYEPNDDIYNPRALQLGSEIDANIMDKQDTDYFSFECPKPGSVKVTIRNRSSSLIPALTTFSPEMRSSGFGPDVHTPGANLEHSFSVEANRKYFVQVWSQADTAGAYSLKIEQ